MSDLKSLVDDAVWDSVEYSVRYAVYRSACEPLSNASINYVWYSVREPVKNSVQSLERPSVFTFVRTKTAAVISNE